MFYVHSSRLKRLADTARANHWYDGEFAAILDATDEQLVDPEGRFSFEHFIRVYRALLGRCGDPQFGLHLGQDSTLGGAIGMMCASAVNLQEAFEQGAPYFQMLGNISQFEFLHESPVFIMRLHLVGPWHELAPDVALHEVDGMFSFFTRIVRLNSNEMVRPKAVRFQRDKTGLHGDYRKLLGVMPTLGERFNEIIYDERDMLTPMKAFNADVYRLLKAHLEETMRRQHRSTKAKVQSLLLAGLDYRLPDMEEVAKRLGLSRRSLQRKLQGEGTNFKEIVQETRSQLAVELLRGSDLTVSEIAYTLGYSDDSNFTRAFRKITGRTPGSFREE